MDFCLKNAAPRNGHCFPSGMPDYTRPWRSPGISGSNLNAMMGSIALDPGFFCNEESNKLFSVWQEVLVGVRGGDGSDVRQGREDQDRCALEQGGIRCEFGFQAVWVEPPQKPDLGDLAAFFRLRCAAEQSLPAGG